MIKVLIVEDNRMLGLINRKGLERLGYNVVGIAVSGNAAIDAVKQHHPDVIIMDIRLEGEMDGVDAMVAIGKFSSTPAIYLTGNSDQIYKDRASKTNMLAFCVKPVYFEELDAHLKKIQPN
jgi:two-component system, response regulator PdtaR